MMGIEARNGELIGLGVLVQPADVAERLGKSLVTGEVVNIRVYKCVYNPVYTVAVEPAPDADELADHRVRFEGERARHAAHLRVIGQVDLD